MQSSNTYNGRVGAYRWVRGGVGVDWDLERVACVGAYHQTDMGVHFFSFRMYFSPVYIGVLESVVAQWLVHKCKFV